MGVVDCGVRGSALSIPSFLAIIMSSVAWAMALEVPSPTSLALECLAGDLLEAHWLAEYLGHDLRNLVEGQVFGAKHCGVTLSAP